jgi:COP9 signalosome complex subunit 1
MDIDRLEEAQEASHKNYPRRLVIPVDDAHPFDLEGYISNYSGIVSFPF